jgi:hypothetical protein
MPVFYPVSRVGGVVPDLVRGYRLDGHDAYVVVVAQGGLGQYYDLQGTTWSNPPILNNPNQTVQLGSRTVRVYFEGHRIRMVAWTQGPGVYWVVNTLQNILTNDQMLAIAGAAKQIR